MFYVMGEVQWRSCSVAVSTLGFDPGILSSSLGKISLFFGSSLTVCMKSINQSNFWVSELFPGPFWRLLSESIQPLGAEFHRMRWGILPDQEIEYRCTLHSIDRCI